MNTIAIKIVQQLDGYPAPYRAAHISIDGRSLLEMLREYERPYAQREGHPSIAGGYVWPEVSSVTRDTFLGKGADENGRMALLDCSCGTPGCWPLMLHVSIGAEEVVWSAFEQPHRSEGHPAGQWHYEGFGSFVFQRAQYDAEIAKIA